jgi:restriction system protein
MSMPMIRRGDPSGNNIGASAVRDFFGSLDRFKAAKGVFVTTSDFSKEARDTAELLSKRIVLINGERLTDLMVRHDVGCRVEETLHAKKVDEDFFLEE